MKRNGQSNRQYDMDWYLTKYPDAAKWINECPACHAKGYKPDMPAHIGSEASTAAWHLRRMFSLWKWTKRAFALFAANSGDKQEALS